MKKTVVGIIAHVDAGKTTLTEGMLYLAGKIKTQGRVDKRNTFLDTHELEREDVYKRQAHDIADVLEAKDRTKAGKTAPPDGLYLTEVE